jgi:putative spermidine/putrescine transport system ATP-binding protein
MADRLVVMSNGQVQQVGSQRDLYERPANAFVAGFVGRTNFLHGRVEAPGVFRSESGLAIRCDEAAAGNGHTMALRPERLSLATTPVPGADNCFAGTVEFASYLGGILEYYVRLTPQDRLMVQATNKLGDPAYVVGDRVHLYWPAQASLVLAGDGGRHGLIENTHRRRTSV